MMYQIDWENAAKMCDELKGFKVYAGLIDDWWDTSGEIFDGEKRVYDEYVFACSKWATPGIMVERSDGFCKFIPCYKEGDDSDMPDWWTEGVE